MTGGVIRMVAMTLPILSVIRPSSLLTQPNGDISPALLVQIHPSYAAGKLHVTAARAWKALVDESAKIGIPLTFTYGGLYRSYADQVKLFKERYVPFVQYEKDGVTETKRKWWDGKWWWKKMGVAAAAVPGTSNHGWALAIDTAFDKDPTDGVGPDDAAAITGHPKWPEFQKLVVKYGFSWEDPDEPWHIRYVKGDMIPQAVLDFEAGVVMQFPPFDPAKGQYSLWPLVKGKSAVMYGSTGDPVKYLQGVLKNKVDKTIVVDGKFGLQTEGAVKVVQKFFGLTVDGWVGNQTWAKIDWMAGT